MDHILCRTIQGNVFGLFDLRLHGTQAWHFENRIATGWWFSPVSSTNKTDRHDITEILLKVALSTINPIP